MLARTYPLAYTFNLSY